MTASQLPVGSEPPTGGPDPLLGLCLSIPTLGTERTSPPLSSVLSWPGGAGWWVGRGDHMKKGGKTQRSCSKAGEKNNDHKVQ